MAVDPPWHQGMEHVIRAALESGWLYPGTPGRDPGPGPDRKLALVPAEPAIVFVVEEVQFLLVADRGEHGRVPAEHVEQRGGAAALGADDQEARQHPQPVGWLQGSDHALPCDPPEPKFPAPAG